MNDELVEREKRGWEERKLVWMDPVQLDLFLLELLKSHFMETKMRETSLLPAGREVKWESFWAGWNFQSCEGSPCRSIIHVWTNWTVRICCGLKMSPVSYKWFKMKSWSRTVVMWSSSVTLSKPRGLQGRSRWDEAGCETLIPELSSFSQQLS